MTRPLLTLALLLQIPPVSTYAPSVGGSTNTSVSVSSLNEALIGYWKLDEASGQRNDSIAGNHLTDVGTVPSTAGILDTWYYITCSYDPATHKATITRNAGADSAIGTAMVGHPKIDFGYGGGTFAIGWDKFHSTVFATFDMDEVGLWNKVLTQREIDLRYNGGAGRTWPF
jgi:hypothetical protein